MQRYGMHYACNFLRFSLHRIPHRNDKKVANNFEHCCSEYILMLYNETQMFTPSRGNKYTYKFTDIQIRDEYTANNQSRRTGERLPALVGNAPYREKSLIK